MPLIIRNDAPDATHHAMFRSLPEIVLFLDDLDRAVLLDILGIARLRFRFHILAFALMLNHIHLLLHRTRVPLSRIMQFVNGAYARYYNRRHQRRGHVLDRRYKSKRVFNSLYQRVATVYIHRNLVFVGTPLSELARNPWNGHGALIGARSSPLISVPRALAPWSEFGDPRAAYLEQMNIACAEYGPFEELFPSDEPVVEEHEVDDPLAEIEPEIAIAILTDEICARTGASRLGLQRGVQTTDVAVARAVLAWIFEALFPFSRAEIAMRLGVSDSAISRAIRRGEQHAANIDFGVDAATSLVLRYAGATSEEPRIVTTS